MLRPSAVVIIEGLFTLHWPELRELLGTKVFVDMNDEVCLTRRQARDVRERGRTPESVIEQYTTTVAPMAQRYVRPTIVHADVVVSGSEPIGDGVARVLAHYRRQVADCQGSTNARVTRRDKPCPQSRGTNEGPHYLRRSGITVPELPRPLSPNPPPRKRKYSSLPASCCCCLRREDRSAPIVFPRRWR